MIIDKAIERLEYSYHHNTILFNNLDKDALKLGIEALKKIKGVREGKEWVGISPLSGETKE